MGQWKTCFVFYFLTLNFSNWLLKVILWELKFFKIIGYDINFAEYVKDVEIKGNKKYIVESNKKIIPNFLIDSSIIPIDNNEIINGYKIVGDFLDKTILKPNNISYPVSRSEFLNLIKLI